METENLIADTLEEFFESDQSRLLDRNEYIRQRNALMDARDAGPTPLEDYPSGPDAPDAGEAMDGGGVLPEGDGIAILDEDELLERSNRKGILEGVGIENPIEKKILSGWRLPESDSDPYFRGMRYNEIQDLRQMQRVVLGEEEVNPIEEEAARAVAGGTLDTLDSLSNILIRGRDLVSGKMDEEGDEYEPEWSFSKQFGISPIELDTQWGPYLESIIHYGSLGTTIVGAIAVSPFTLPAVGKGGMVGKAATGILQGGIVGGLQDAISIRSHEQNASSMLIKRFPQLESLLGPLATKDTDSAAWIYLKNILEGLGFEALLGGTAELLGQGLNALKRARVKDKAKVSVLKNLEDRFNQAQTKGEAEFNEQDEFLRTISELERRQTTGEEINIKAEEVPPAPYMGNRGHANQNLTDAWQGTPNSRSTPYDNWSNLNKIDKDEPFGSVDSALTPIEAENIATDGIQAHKKFFNEWRDSLFNDPRLADVIKKGKKQGRSTYSIFKQSLNRYGDLIGQHYKNKDWEKYFKITGLSYKDSVAAEAFVNSIFKQIRDVATAAKEIKRMGGDIFSVDGPMKTIADRMVNAFETLHYHRAVANSNVDIAQKVLPQIHKDTLEGVDLLMNFLDREAGEELVDEVLKFLSTAHKSGKVSDFNNWMRQKMTGGDMLPGKNKQGALMDELATIHINSMFGPKTLQRTLWGTGFNSYLTQFHDTFGAALRYPLTRDPKQFKAQFASFMSMLEFIPDSFKIFRHNLNEAFKADAIVDTRYSRYGRSQLDTDAYEQWLKIEGSESDKIVYNIWSVARNLNSSDSLIGKLHSGVSRSMDAADKTFKELIRHRRVKEVSMRDALIAQEMGDISEITDDVLNYAGKLYEQKYYNEFGDIDLRKEAFTQNDFDEVTYRTELTGMSKAFAEFVEQVPFIKPFHRFIRSGINGLTVKTQNMGFLAALVEKERAIALATPDDLSGVMKYGIDNAWDLEKMKARQWSRQAVGYGLVYMAALKYLSGGLTGNGPADQGKRNVMIDSGWERNSITIGGKRINLDLFEPFDLLLKGVADIGDNMELMGPQWAEDKLRAFAIVTAFTEAASNQTYLSSIGDIVDLLRGEPGSISRLTTTVTNFVPFAGWRRTLGNTLTNQYRELNSSIWSDRGLFESGPIQAVRRNNLTTEWLAPLTGNEPLPVKYNMLNGRPLKETNVLGRAWRSTSILEIEPDSSPGQKLLWRSNYDLRVSTWASPGPDFISLKDQNFLRSEFAREIGLTRINGENPQEWLDNLAKDPRIIASIQEMVNDKKRGEHALDPRKSYYHNKIIHAGFQRRRRLAWEKVRQLPEAAQLIKDRLDLKTREAAKLQKTANQPLPLHPAR